MVMHASVRRWSLPLLVAMLVTLVAPIAHADITAVPACGYVELTSDANEQVVRLIPQAGGYIGIRVAHERAILTGHGRDAVLDATIGGRTQRQLAVTGSVSRTFALAGPTSHPRVLVRTWHDGSPERLTAFDLDGQLDTSFGSQGVFLAPAGWWIADVLERPSGALAIFMQSGEDTRIVLTSANGTSPKAVAAAGNAITGQTIQRVVPSGEDHAWVLTWTDPYGNQSWIDRISLTSGQADAGFGWDGASDPDFIAAIDGRLLAVEGSGTATLHGTNGARVSSFGSGGQVDLTGFLEGGIANIGDAPGERILVVGRTSFSPDETGAVMLGTGGVVTSVGNNGRFGPAAGAGGPRVVVGLPTGEVVIEDDYQAVVFGPDGKIVTDCGSLRNPRVIRRHGLDRYETAAALVGTVDSADTVVVATGKDFPDALAGGAVAAALGGPLLLVTKGDVPRPTREQLSRLRPSRILVMGGPNSVADGVLAFLAQQSWGPSVERISGDTRYDTALRASERAFPDGSDWVFIATGTGFADALAAVPVAAYLGGPILLTAGPKPSDQLLAEVDRLDPEQVVIVGGPNSVPYDIEQYFYQRELYPQRFAGVDRFHTAARLGELLPSSSGATFLASGAQFADALAAGPIAGRRVAPLLLTSSDRLPEQARAEMARRSAQVVYVAGGPNSVGDGVLAGIDGTVLGYTFIAYRDEGESDPLQWDACRPIPWRWYRGESPDSDLQFLKDGVAAISKQTGVQFSYEGTTETSPHEGFSPNFVTMGFQYMIEAGLAGPQIAGGNYYTGGTVAISSPLSGRTWDGKDFASLVLAHELGHLLGLGHVRSPLEIMTDGFLDDSHQAAVYQAGDRAGLARTLDFSRC